MILVHVPIAVIAISFHRLTNKRKLQLYNLRSFLKGEFVEDVRELMRKLLKHSYCLYVPMVQMLDTLTYLREKYDKKIIMKNIYAILYHK